MNEELNNWREDEIDDVLSQAEALTNSPVKMEHILNFLKF
jgi:Asp-tRNA(Asn)/Glu-tRNA(Gln) amidotransferase C subunit